MNIISNIKTKFQNTVEAISKDKVIWIDIKKIKIDPELKAIFEQQEKDIQNIYEDMKIHGFDPAHPIILSQNNENVDGNTRYICALKLGLTKVPVIYKHFNSRKEMLEFAYSQQLRRRNLSEGEIYKAYVALSKITDANGKKLHSDEAIAEQLDISRRQVSKIKEVEKKSDPKTLESFKAGEISLNAAYQKIKSKESETKRPHVPSIPKTVKKTYKEGYSEGIKYALHELANGKTSEELLAELSTENSHE